MPTTADQIFVQIQVNVDQYSKAMAKVAGDTTRNMAMVQEVITKTEVNVTRSWQRQAAASEQSSRRRAKAAQDGATSEKAAAALSSAATEQVGRDTERLTVQLQNATRTRTTLAREAAASGREMAGSFGGGLSKLLGFLGPIGTIIEIVANGIQIAQAAMGFFAGSTEEANEALEAFNGTVGASQGLSDAAAKGYVELATQLAKASEAAILGRIAQIDTRKEALRGEVTAAASDIEAKINDALTALSQGVMSEKALLPVTENFARLFQLIREAPLDTKRWVDLAHAADELREKTDGSVDRVNALSTSTKATAGNIETIATETRDLNAQFQVLTDNGQASSDTVSDIGSSSNTAKGQVDGLNGSVVQLALSFSHLAKARSIGFGRMRGFGFIQGEQEPAADPSGMAFGGMSTGLYIGNIEPEPPSFRDSGTGAGRGGGVRSKASGAPAAGSGQDALATLQSLIDLNQQLIAAYHRGKAALAEVRAGQEAVNAALQKGLDVHSDEYKIYVENYKQKALEAEQSKTRLADLERGTELTKSLMSETEKLKVLEADYNKLRQEGALTQEAHDRLLAAAREQAYGYSEGIKAIGEAIQGGIQGATSFSDALLKVGTSLAQLLLQAALFGGGPLGKLFDSLIGSSGGLLGLAFGGGGGGGLNLNGPVPSQSTLPRLASGGQALPGKLYQVGETGREWFAPSVPGQVIPNHVIKAAAGGGGGSGGPPINFNISLAGANGDRTIAEIAAAAVKKGLAQVPEINRQHRIRFA